MLACEDEITPSLEEADPVLSVDAWVTDQAAPQVIRLTQTTPYFDQTVVPVTEAQVVITNGQGEVFSFSETAPGNYTWNPTDVSSTLGTVGETYRLTVTTDGQTYEATSTMTAVPPIDSITYEFQESFFGFPATYIAEFWATDPLGEGNAYWIRYARNDTLFNGPDDISLAFDAGFSQGGNLDGVVFIQPIRASINPVDEDDEGEILPAYRAEDSVYVELHSLTAPAYDFLNQVSIQTNRPGGFGELFANPLSNVPTNIQNTSDTGPAAVGFFNVSAVSSAGTRVID